MDKEEERIQNIIDYHETFNSEHGKRCLEHLKKLAQYDIPLQPPRGNDGHIDTIEIVRRDAQRSIIAHIMKMLKKDPKDVKGMINA